MSSSNRVVSIYKPIGVTPGELVQIFKEDNPHFKGEVVSYAGRLDPLAHGVMVLLIGEEENRRRREYEKSDKEYEYEAILGFKTDSYDICGLVTEFKDSMVNTKRDEVVTYINSLVGKHFQPFPPFSSYKVRGKPLFYWAREKRLDEIDIPTKEVEIFSSELIGISKVSGEKLLADIKRRVSLVKGDFRQAEIVLRWAECLDRNMLYTIVKARAHVSSGTYIRGIVDSMGDALGCHATTLEIFRRRSGEHTIADK